MSREQELGAALAAVEQRVRAACAAAGRSREEVLLLAVTKTWPASDVALLHRLGVRAFGENREPEFRAKVIELAALGAAWHWVGQLQTNKARSVAARAALVHSVDRGSLAGALDRAAGEAGRLLDVLVQVDLSGAAGRGGCAPGDLPGLADDVAGRSGLRLRGLMAVAPLGEDPAAAYGRLAGLAQGLRSAHPGATELSAGMSADLEQAVAAGATIVRVGTALLGRRPPPSL